MLCCKSLLDLNAAAMPVHVAKSANVHQNVKPELLPCPKRAQHFVMLSAMAHAGIDYFAPLGLACAFDRSANLPVRVMTVLI